MTHELLHGENLCAHGARAACRWAINQHIVLVAEGSQAVHAEAGRSGARQPLDLPSRTGELVALDLATEERGD